MEVYVDVIDLASFLRVLTCQVATIRNNAFTKKSRMSSLVLSPCILRMRHVVSPRHILSPEFRGFFQVRVNLMVVENVDIVHTQEMYSVIVYKPRKY